MMKTHTTKAVAASNPHLALPLVETILRATSRRAGLNSGASSVLPTTSGLSKYYIHREEMAMILRLPETTYDYSTILIVTNARQSTTDCTTSHLSVTSSWHLTDTLLDARLSILYGVSHQ